MCLRHVRRERGAIKWGDIFSDSDVYSCHPGIPCDVNKTKCMDALGRSSKDIRRRQLEILIAASATFQKHGKGKKNRTKKEKKTTTLLLQMTYPICDSACVSAEHLFYFGNIRPLCARSQSMNKRKGALPQTVLLRQASFLKTKNKNKNK